MNKDNMRWGIGFMVASALSFALMQFCVKMAGDLPFWEKAFFRNLISMVFAGILISHKGLPYLGERKNRHILLGRSFFGTLGVLFYFYSLNTLNMADAAMLNRVSPFVVLVIAAVFLKERITRVQIAGLLVIFTGVLLIIKPEFSLAFLPGLAGFASAVFAGMAYVIVRYLKGREDPLTIVFFFSAFSTLVLFGPTLYVFQWPSPVQWLWLGGIGVTALGGQVFLTLAYKYAPAGEVSIYSYVMVVFSALLGFIFLNETPDFWSIIGGTAIMLTALVLYLWSTGRLKLVEKNGKEEMAGTTNLRPSRRI